MKVLIWLLIGIVIGTFFGAVILGWFFANFFEGVNIIKDIFNITK